MAASGWSDASNLLVRRKTEFKREGEAEEDGESLDLADVIHAQFQMKGPKEHEEAPVSRKNKKRSTHHSSVRGSATKGSDQPLNQDSLDSVWKMSSPSVLTPSDSDFEEADSFDIDSLPLTGSVKGSKFRKSMVPGDAPRKSSLLPAPSMRKCSILQAMEKGAKPSQGRRGTAIGRRSSVAANNLRRRSTVSADVRALGHEDVRLMRPKVSAMFQECLQRATLKLTQRFEKEKEWKKQSSDMMLDSAIWPYEALPPMLCVRDARTALTDDVEKSARKSRRVKLSSAVGKIEVRMRTHARSSPIGNIGRSHDLLDSPNPQVVHEAFRKALAEAKQAQEQAKTVRSEVQRLRDAILQLEKNKAKALPQVQVWGCRPKKKSAPEDIPPSLAEMLEKQAWLRASEAKLRFELDESKNQNLQLELEVQRRMQRLVLVQKQIPAQKALPRLISCRAREKKAIEMPTMSTCLSPLSAPLSARSTPSTMSGRQASAKSSESGHGTGAGDAPFLPRHGTAMTT